MKVKVDPGLWNEFSRLRKKKGDLIRELSKALDLYSGYLNGTLAVRTCGERREVVNVETVGDVLGVFVPIFGEFPEKVLEKLVSRAEEEGRKVLTAKNMVCIY